MSEEKEKPSHRTQVIITVITVVGGLIGTLGVALFTNWEKIFPPRPSPTPAPISQASPQPSQTMFSKADPTGITPASVNTAGVTVPSTSLNELSRQIKPRARRAPEQIDTFNGRPRHYYYIWLDGPAAVLDQIEKVSYHYDQYQFENQRRESYDRSSGFQDSYLGIGAVDRDMDIVLTLRDRRELTLKLNVYRTVFGN